MMDRLGCESGHNGGDFREADTKRRDGGNGNSMNEWESSPEARCKYIGRTMRDVT